MYYKSKTNNSLSAYYADIFMQYRLADFGNLRTGIFQQSYDANLSPGASWSAHASQLFSLDAAGGRVYSASNDGGVRVWTDEGEKLCNFPHTEGDIESLHVYGTNVFTGDEVGNVSCGYYFGSTSNINNNNIIIQ